MPKTDAQMPDQQAANDDAQQSKDFNAAAKAEADMHKRHAKEIAADIIAEHHAKTANREGHELLKSETSRAALPVPPKP
jgi:hypothetical protein